MKQISFWAREHKKAARIYIVIGFLFLNVSGLFVGDLLHSLTGIFNPALILIPVTLTIAGYIFYPRKKNKRIFKNFYFRQKLNDLVLIGSTFLFLIFIGNNTNTIQSLQQPLLASTSVFHPSRVIKPTTVSHSSKSLRQRIKAYRKAYKEMTKTQKTLAIIGIIILASFVAAGVGALSCNIACSGSESLSIVVLVIGLAGVVFGAIKLIQRITRGPKKPVAHQALE
jgi:hypothetical protein